MSKRAPIRVGVAGWDYRDWKGIVYPQPRPRGFDPLRYLADYVDLIEINTTFYGPPDAAVARRWTARVDDVDTFRFTAKLWRRFTHERKTGWTKADVRAVRKGMDALSGRLDAVLVQFPWSFCHDERNLEWLDDVVTAFEAYPLAIEVRHESWNTPDFLVWLADRGAGIVNVDQPLFKRSIRPAALSTSAVGYVRVHGRNYSDWFRKDAGRDVRYDYLYSPDELRPWARRARQVADHAATDHVDVVFNNHYRGQAVTNALQFRKLIDGRLASAPPQLVETYAAELSSYARAMQDGPAADSEAA